MKIKTYSAKGTKVTPTNSPKDWKGEVNMVLLAQAVRVYEDKTHTGLSSTKTRSQIVASTRKIYRQKGTGGARHGAKSAPIFVGGSKAHGPKGVKRSLKLSSKMRKKALISALVLKTQKDRLVAVKTPEKLSKTGQAYDLLQKIQKDLKITNSSQKLTVVLSEKAKEARRVFRNIENVKVLSDKSMNAYDVYLGGLLVFDTQIFSK
ncbi:50S ribosomal protein L4 [Patescibacteria group bacterium]